MVVDFAEVHKGPHIVNVLWKGDAPTLSYWAAARTLRHVTRSARYDHCQHVAISTLAVIEDFVSKQLSCPFCYIML